MKYGMSIEEMIEIIAGMDGVIGIDLCSEYLPCYPGINLFELNRIISKCKENHLLINSTWFMADIASGCYASSENEFLEEMEKYIAITAACESEFITIPMLFYVPGYTMEQYYEVMMRFFEKALPIAQQYHVRIAHELPREGSPEIRIRLAKALNDKYYTLAPDLEAWRIATEDLPLSHAEMGSDEHCEPASMTMFEKCLPYSPNVHYKLLSLDSDGEDPHFPISEIMPAINASPIEHHLNIEYEGWIPGIHPERDCIEETRRCAELIRRYKS